MMHVHILGICGTFMGSLALLARAAGFRVTGSDENVYPPMSTMLDAEGVEIFTGHSVEHLEANPDYIVVGNVMRRGMPIIEYLLNNNLRFCSGPEFLKQHVLQDKYVLAVSGTHGKTTTSSMLAWILHCAGKKPGFLIGGVPQNFGISAKLGSGEYFVIEADEYDSAFFDKRSKFIHYKPNTLIINNIEFDHADIFNDLQDITRQFHHLLKIIPNNGTVVYRDTDPNIKTVLQQGIWSKSKSFDLRSGDLKLADVPNLKLKILGEHNKLNALASIAAASSIGIPASDAVEYLKNFTGVKRRLELVGEAKGVKIIDDFAHHPTAIRETLAAVKASVQESQAGQVSQSNQSDTQKSGKKLITIVDICSNTMRMGEHKETLLNSLQDADLIYFFHTKQLGWDINEFVKTQAHNVAAKVMGVYADTKEILANLVQNVNSGDVVLFLSNGSCGGLQQELLQHYRR
jgi:UDP-N-acetylmuramate: L-alanyl-gamma-D-glutamyl-meso-diaminopimelate ligase